MFFYTVSRNLLFYHNRKCSKYAAFFHLKTTLLRYQFLIYLKLDFLECKEAHHCALSKHCPSLQKKTKKFGKNGVNIENLNKQYKNVLKKKPTWIEIFCTIFFGVIITDM